MGNHLAAGLRREIHLEQVAAGRKAHHQHPRLAVGFLGGFLPEQVADRTENPRDQQRVGADYRRESQKHHRLAAAVQLVAKKRGLAGRMVNRPAAEPRMEILRELVAGRMVNRPAAELQMEILQELVAARRDLRPVAVAGKGYRLLVEPAVQTDWRFQLPR
jgi:hypothetical protein